MSFASSEVGHTDTAKTSVLHVASIGLVVARDAVYNGVHQYLVESGNGGLQKWTEALDSIAELRPMQGSRESQESGARRRSQGNCGNPTALWFWGAHVLFPDMVSA
jgi:hypothetical protein